MIRRFRFDSKLGEMVELTNNDKRESKKGARDLGALWGDRHYDGLQATDGADISSRKKHREYMRRMGYTTADDFTNTWAEAKKKREFYMQNGGSINKQDVRNAIEQLRSKR